MAQNTRIQNNPLWTKTIHNDQPRHPEWPKMAYNHLVNDKNTWTIVDIETKVFYFFPKKLQDMMVKKQTCDQMTKTHPEIENTVSCYAIEIQENRAKSCVTPDEVLLHCM